MIKREGDVGKVETAQACDMIRDWYEPEGERGTF